MLAVTLCRNADARVDLPVRGKLATLESVEGPVFSQRRVLVLSRPSQDRSIIQIHQPLILDLDPAFRCDCRSRAHHALHLSPVHSTRAPLSPTPMT